MTIPQLRKAFEKIDSFLKTKVKGLSGDEAEKAFRKEWKKIFGKDVSSAAARDYLAYVSSEKGSSSVQKGGAAPVDWMMTSGGDLPYGKFLPYVTGGFAYPQDSFSLQCGKENITPNVPAGLGTNAFPKALVGGGRGKKHRTTRRKQKGGALPSLATVAAEIMQRPAGANSPNGFFSDVQFAFKGVSQDSPNPIVNPLPYVNPQGAFMGKVAPTFQ